MAPESLQIEVVVAKLLVPVEDQGSRERCLPCARAITRPKRSDFYVDFVRKYSLRQLLKGNVKAMDAQQSCDYVELAEIAVCFAERAQRPTGTLFRIEKLQAHE